MHVRRNRGFNSATASPPWMTSIPAWGKRSKGKLLQFGHSVAAVDDGSCSTPSWGVWKSFNSATASPPWMTVLLHGDESS